MLKSFSGPCACPSVAAESQWHTIHQSHTEALPSTCNPGPRPQADVLVTREAGEVLLALCRDRSWPSSSCSKSAVPEVSDDI